MQQIMPCRPDMHSTSGPGLLNSQAAAAAGLNCPSACALSPAAVGLAGQAGSIFWN